MESKTGASPQPLTHLEIDDRLEQIGFAVMRRARAVARPAAGEPVWLNTAELVRRMRPHLGLN